ncbi:aminotransferase class V-fold PLP-dependent enzyme [Protaetiibacter mangrovi]|uniref:Aminotransferase class V-fold PLP-dependent enzyme n=1 Tax=Protaetiibacter mangrovi TaxID=2970926 RepID=A0ABT1ZGS2_9MICO|nr:aminotransferase class V-fold PLP-dependent enzyme [Protaetiibacter mangrovi]MCS0499880.1 aminotransferase class V-fold PLP-dependent enzyme [Protaetiibacter mangrovi]TPX05103.1 aminotransferase class V-fold PLP-dependent enzyme [Schumannella luteola]
MSIARSPEARTSTPADAPPPLLTRSGVPAAALWALDPQVVHLNHGSFGAAPRSTVELRSVLLAEVDANPLRWHLSVQPRREEARLVVARFLGSDPRSLAFVPSASAGTTAVLRELSGGEVVVTDHAYGALAKHVALQAARVGARVVTARVPLSATAAEATAAVLDAIGPETRLVVLDHVTSATARLMPVEQVSEAARARGVAVLVDAAHAPGMLEAPAATTADAWVGNLHKWACGVRGSAVTVLNAATAERVRPPIESWSSDAAYPESFDEQGTADSTGYLASAAGITALEEAIGWDRIRLYQGELVSYGRDIIAAAFAYATGEDHRVEVGMPAPSMALVALPSGLAAQPESAAALRQRIADELGFETQIADWGGVARLRLSAHAYSTSQDFDRFAETVVPALVQWSRSASKR